MAASNITLSLGLMSVPMQKANAIERAPAMANLCPGQPGKPEHTPTPVKAPRTCIECGEITDATVLVKGVKQGSTYTLIDAEEVAEAKAEFTGEHKGKISLVAHPAKEFLEATAPGDTIYYLTPASAGDVESQYQILVKLIEAHPELVFAGLHTPSSVTALFMLAVRDGALVMQKRVREQAIKPAPSIGGEVDERLLAMLEASLPMLTADYDPEAYEDRYAAALERLIAEGDQVAIEAPTTATPVQMSNVELMERLANLRSVA